MCWRGVDSAGPWTNEGHWAWLLFYVFAYFHYPLLHIKSQTPSSLFFKVSGVWFLFVHQVYKPTMDSKTKTFGAREWDGYYVSANRFENTKRILLSSLRFCLKSKWQLIFKGSFSFSVIFAALWFELICFHWGWRSPLFVLVCACFCVAAALILNPHTFLSFSHQISSISVQSVLPPPHPQS